MRGGLGAGDVKLAAFLGAVVGFPRVISALLLGMLAGGVVVLLLLLLRAVRRGQYLPYGPFLVLGGVVALFWGDVLPRGLWG
jgi:prepilin signal peptidase PulO-like enzyme (type II secretory pathway)